MAEPSVTIRLPAELKDKIVEKVDTGEFRSITDFIDRAVREKLNRDMETSITLESLQSQIDALKLQIWGLTNK